jgi:hypothetical protein
MDAEPTRLRLFGFSEFRVAKLLAGQAQKRPKNGMNAVALGRHGCRL